MSQLILRNSIGVIDLIAEDKEGHARELFHSEEGVQLGFGLGESLEVLGVYQENDSANFGEVVFPEAAGW